MDFIYGDNFYLAKKHTKKLISSYGIKPEFFNSNNSFAEIFRAVSAISILEPNKLIIIKNHPILTMDNDVFLDNFLSSLKNGLNLNVIFILSEKKINYKNLLIKHLMFKENVYKCMKPLKKDLNRIIPKIVKENGGSIDFAAVNMLIECVPLDLNLIEIEIKKLLLIKNDIDVKIINETIIKDYEENIYAIPNAINNCDSNEILTAVNNRLQMGDSVINIISQISSIFILSVKIWEAKQQNLSLYEIANRLKIHVFRVKKANYLLNNLKISLIKNLLKTLSKLDFDIKKGHVDGEFALDYWILGLIKII